MSTTVRFRFLVAAGSEEELRECADRYKVTIVDKSGINSIWDAYICEAPSKVHGLTFAQEFMGKPDVMENIAWQG